jgi:hypothetical protein
MPGSAGRHLAELRLDPRELQIVVEAMKQLAETLTDAPFMAARLMQLQPMLAREDVPRTQQGRPPKQ